ncbi:protein of unknown function [Candidatus Methylomirabilis oxygeniifera]|uniref:Uncharacterized protein n=1 Tax=Methylomirabilis oxygeniifera TaxID=671143 RepID=D5MGC2_METO1|nr:protein of unknown function [Candidatus Methylomirabilis oxyfera]
MSDSGWIFTGVFTVDPAERRSRRPKGWDRWTACSRALKWELSAEVGVNPLRVHPPRLAPGQFIGHSD